MEEPVQAAARGAMEKGAGLKLPAIGRYRLVLEAKEPLRLPDYSGSAWRGVFGNGLRRTVCATGASSCDGCLLLNHCVYAYVFETPPPRAPASCGSTPQHPIRLCSSPPQTASWPWTRGHGTPSA